MVVSKWKTGVAALMASTAIAGSAAAQVQAAPEDKQESEITVTGTRVMRDGYEAPVPTTVLGEEAILAKGRSILLIL